jgi:hypothetical protein
VRSTKDLRVREPKPLVVIPKCGTDLGGQYQCQWQWQPAAAAAAAEAEVTEAAAATAAAVSCGPSCSSDEHIFRESGSEPQDAEGRWAGHPRRPPLPLFRTQPAAQAQRFVSLSLRPWP